MARPPLVSILLPAFNAAATLPACLRSVQRQAEPGWQCVIVDDGSGDGTLACARHFAARDERFEVIPAPHLGLVSALNTGLAHCRGRYVARMDADDVMHRERLAVQVRALEATPELAAVGCHVRLFPRDGLRAGRRAYERWLNNIDSAHRVREEAFVECPIVHPTLVIRRELLVEFGYRDAGWPEDYDLLLRLLAAGYEISVVPRRLLCWRDRPARLSRTSPVYGLDRFAPCKAAFLAAQFLAGHDTYILWGYGDTGRALRRALLAHGKRPSHIVEVHAGRLGNRIHGAAVISPQALAALHGHRLIASVAGAQPRRQIRQALQAMGFCELHDFVCAA
ncbi:MAG: glycosyltransferase family 2 protein [Deltaproteobacteria bacterium]|nr:glycosyltransferase family 2 protein [Deltaproteobacteria bacterium]